MKYEETINIEQKIILINQVIEDLNKIILELEDQELVFNHLIEELIKENI